MTAAKAGWLELNQHDLMANVRRVAQALERHASAPGDRAPAGEQQDVERDGPEPDAQASDEKPTALGALCRGLGLSPFERDILLLTAGVELDGRFPALCAAAHGDGRRDAPTFGLALAAMPDAHWSAVGPAAPLRRWHLVEFRSGESLVYAPLRIDERVLHYLTGLDVLDTRLEGRVTRVNSSGIGAPSHEGVVDRILAAWQGDGEWPSIQLCGEIESTAAIAAAACAEVGLRLHQCHAAEIPANSEERDLLIRLWEREAVLSRSALLVEWEDDLPPDTARVVAAFVERVHAVVLLAGREPVTVRRRPLVRLDVDRVPAAEQRVLWEEALGAATSTPDWDLPAVVSQFDFGPSSIRAVAGQVLSGAADEAPAERLWTASRVQARTRLDGLAQRLVSTATWDDLVLPEAQRQTLHEIAVHVHQRHRVYEDWGFAARTSRGLGIGALFAGHSGTGKTMAAEVLANELRLDLFRIDLSAVVSKYIGETEKNLNRVFAAAQVGGAILLFDEADALFGKRSEVRDSHDRYANLEISYLLQRMETYRGLAILTTNLQQALDPAFLRRLRFVVQFPFPDAAQRAEIWRRVFPASTPTEHLEAEGLARLQITGGHIRNIAMNAAFLAADAGEPVRMGHIVRAARTEYAKLDRPLTEFAAGDGR